MATIEQNLALIKKSIAEFEQKNKRIKGSVKLLAASKGQSIDKILAAFHSGHREFGESYLQEAMLKMSKLEHEPITWHFIGPIQSNKTRKIAENFAWVHSVDSPKILTRLNDQRPEYLPPLNVCIEVNVSDEPTKSGVTIEQAYPLAHFCRKLTHLKLRGLMTIPAPMNNFNDQRREFHKLQVLFNHLNEQGFNLDTLSMGMSEDYEAAIAEGSTIVRIGRAIFGEMDLVKT